MEMVEQIARALAEVEGLDWDTLPEGKSDGISADECRETYRRLAQSVLPFIATERERCDLTWDAGFNLAMAAGELIKSTDGLEQVRPQRQAVLDAMKQFEAIRSQQP